MAISGAHVAAALEIGAQVAPAVLALKKSDAEKQALAAYRSMLGYDPTKMLQKELPGMRQRILSQSQEAQAQLGRGGLAGGRKTQALGKLYEATQKALATGESQLRDRLMQEHLQQYKIATEGLTGLAGVATTRKADAAKLASEIDLTDTAKSMEEYYTQKRKKKAELGGKTPTTGGTT